MISESTDKVYVYFIDGTFTFVPINARHINDTLFEILDDPEYSDIDGSVLFEFYPGDIVEVVESENLDNEYRYFAKTIIQPSKRADRDYLEFKYRATQRNLPIDKSTVLTFKDVIKRIKKENSEPYLIVGQRSQFVRGQAWL